MFRKLLLTTGASMFLLTGIFAAATTNDGQGSSVQATPTVSPMMSPTVSPSPGESPMMTPLPTASPSPEESPMMPSPSPTVK